VCPHDISPGLFLWIAIQASLPAAIMIPSLPGLTRQSILFERLFRSVMDARVKPAHD
jgi:hypothetical protein